jgi:hypothetical protein
MRLGHRGSRVATVSALATLALASLASAQERAGVVTTLEGKVTVARASAPELSPLKFRDAVFVRDRIATGKDSFARILLGGRAVVTIREYSAVTITEVPGVATIDVGSGRVAVAVARERMRQGDLVEVRTPNAVAGIRGTVIVAEVFDTHRSAITVLKGVIDVTRVEAGRLVGPSTVLNALQQVTVNGAVSAPQSISSDAARKLRDEFRTTPPRAVPAASTAAVSDGEMERVANDNSGSFAAASVRRLVQTPTDQSGGDSDKGKSTQSGTAVVSTGSSSTGATASTSSAPSSGASPSSAPSGTTLPDSTSTTAATTPTASTGTIGTSSAPVATTSVSTAPSAPVASAPAPVTTIAAPVTTAVTSVPVAATTSVTTTVTSTAAAASAPVTTVATSPTTTIVTTAISTSSGKDLKLPKPDKSGKKY